MNLRKIMPGGRLSKTSLSREKGLKNMRFQNKPDSKLPIFLVLPFPLLNETLTLAACLYQCLPQV